MISRIFIACLFLGMYSTGSLLGCKWIVNDRDEIKDQFHVYNKRALGFLDMMITNTTKDAEIEHTVAFPNELYHQKSNATDEDKLALIVQILKELFALFEEHRSSAPWEENTVENFLSIVDKMAEELNSCVGSHSNTTQLSHFTSLSNETLKANGYSAEAWETIRNITKEHLRRCGSLVESLGNAH
ncbi:interferon a3-like [Haplochromis burtoni]|uniref:interferon a3-like n=1 Tax=Haplochromis burtoni TaxID=8153 RepID=UPI0003BD2B57|nr:interferon a3-like [Haplochromis burtoni]